MASKTILAVMLVAALGLVPTGVALNVEAETPAFPVLPTAPIEETLDPVTENVAKVQELVDGLLACQVLVRLPVTLIYADITDERDENTAFMLERELENLVDTLETPIYETTEETVWSPSGLLGFLQPITKEVTTLTGYQTEEIIENVPVDLNVRLDWHEEYLDFTDPHQLEIYLPVPVGLPFLDVGGAIMTVCEEVDVYNQVPSFSRNGHDMLFVYLGTEQRASHFDGWYMDAFTVDVSLATGDSRDLPRGYMISSTSMLNRMEAEVTNYMNGLDPEVAKYAAGKDGYESEARQEAISDSVESQAGSHVLVPASTMAFIALLGSIVLGAVGLLVYKRFGKNE